MGLFFFLKILFTFLNAFRTPEYITLNLFFQRLETANTLNWPEKNRFETELREI